jgi:cytochrome P450
MANPKYFVEPEKFNPDRWINKDSLGASETYSYLPFSAGPHNCIGQVILQYKMFSP